MFGLARLGAAQVLLCSDFRAQMDKDCSRTMSYVEIVLGHVGYCSDCVGPLLVVLMDLMQRRFADPVWKKKDVDVGA